MKKCLVIFKIILFTISIYGQSNTVLYENLAEAAMSLTKQKVKYDPSYFKIKYPNGDVPSDRGVCTDVVIRAFRLIGIDLQKEVHQDMRTHFEKYPNLWRQIRPDCNIDHRRVPNLMTYFTRHRTVLIINQNPQNYSPGDIVSWNLGGAVTHIGIVVKQKSSDGKRHMIIHNIGAGQVIEDCLFKYKIIGHYK
jgi:uncharacterized protein YijF (DUF1287 family)